MMGTTIHVSNTTKQLLEMLKRHEQAANYDGVIRSLIQQHLHLPASLFGAIKGIRWTNKDRIKFLGE